MPTSIDGPVGLRNRAQQVANFERDQEKIKSLLVSIPESQGGKKEKWTAMPPLLGPDGNCTKQLADAIWEFQSFWKARGGLQVADGVVDPGKNSIRKMNELAAGTPVAPVPPAPPAISPLMQRVHNLLPRMIERQRSALNLLAWGRIAIDFPNTNEFNKGALGLIDRCFKIRQAFGFTESTRKEQWKRDIATVAGVYANGLVFLGEPNAKAYFHEVGEAETVRACGKTANAYTNPGTFSEKNPARGIWVNRDKCTSQNDNWLLDALTHELAHFCGPLPSNQVDDHGYGDAALLLPRAKALKNAANHAWFAGLSQTGPSNWPNGTYPS